MAHLSNKTVGNSHLKKKQTSNSNTLVPDESNEVLDLRKSNSEKLCFWCGKRGSLSENGVESDFCSEVCFDQFRRDSFKKRSSCMWCNNSNHGVFNINLMSNLDETKFCSEHCLTQFKVRLFCEETSAHLDKLKEGSVIVTNGLVSSTVTTNSSMKSPVSMTGSLTETPVSLNDLITPDLWLKKSPNMKSSATSVMTSPFHNLHSPRRSSISPPIASSSPSSDQDTLLGGSNLMNVKVGENGPYLNRLQGIGTLPLSNCSSKTSSMISSSGGNVIDETKNLTLGNDVSYGTLKKRIKMNSLNFSNESSNLSLNAAQCQVTKGSHNKTHFRGIRGRKMRMSSQKTLPSKEMEVNSCGNAKVVRPAVNMNSCVPYQHSQAGKQGQIIPHPHNLFMTNGHSNKLNLGSLGFALSGGFGLGGFPHNFLQGDENSTESSSSCSTTSQNAYNATKMERIQSGLGFGCHNQDKQQSKGSQTDGETQPRESDPRIQNVSSSMSILPPLTILVPFPVAVPIPIPIPIPVILGSGFNIDKTLRNFKGTTDIVDNSTTTQETNTSQIRMNSNSTPDKQDVSKENDKEDNDINSNSNSAADEGKEGLAPVACELVKVEDSLSVAR